MSHSTYTKNKYLNSTTPDQVSAHSAFPGTTGANELSGGVYARAAPTLAAASGGTRTISALSIAVPGGSTVRWVGTWESGNYVAGAPNGGSPKEFMADPTADTIICPAHGYSNTQTVVFFNGTPPAPFVEGTIYYVVNAATNTFQLAATSGGAALDITDYGGTGCQVSVIYEDSYASDDVHDISAGTFATPF